MPLGFRITGFDQVAAALDRATAEVRSEVAAELDRLVADGIRYWRANSPYRTGRLRRAERATIIRENGFAVGAQFRVHGQRGRVYFILAHRFPNRYGRLKDLMDMWVAHVGNPRILAAVERALRRAGFQ